MSDNPEIFHRRSIRIKNYDYSQTGYYFITICALNHNCLFGEIKNRIMDLNEKGNIVHEEWIKTTQIRPNVILDAFVIMPNHFHSIVRLKEENESIASESRNHSASTGEQFSKVVPNSIPSIIRGFKSAVTNQINKVRGTQGAKVWQRNYYEHIIRNEKSLFTITEYIKANPLNWEKDKYFK